ncbi:hypothetical protein O3P69_011933 [Scylla paramamosain]|uniref:Uncharacterized protein n=1 Tax=Scylla paramamosain TaxID=85552 RepID=A0AAW0SGL7_SCYPA
MRRRKSRNGASIPGRSSHRHTGKRPRGASSAITKPSRHSYQAVLPTSTDVSAPHTISALTALASLKTSAHPLSPPYELVEENVGRLEKWLLEEFGRTVFATERTPLPEMPEATTDDVGHVVDLRHVEEEAVKDEEYQLLHECVANDGWGERKDAEPAALQRYARTSGCGGTCHVKATICFTPAMRDSPALSSQPPSDAPCSPISTLVIRAQTQCFAEPGSLYTGPASMQK